MAVRPKFRAETIPELEALVFGLGAQSYAQMLGPDRHKIPPLYGGKIRYQREEPRREEWQAALETAERGYGDCEDLAAYRVAELRKQGITAWPVITAINPALRHVTLRYIDPKSGAVVFEDPSKRLGM